MKFWDASGIVPLCLDDPDAPRLRRMAEADPAIVAWWGSPIECCSAFARLRREGTLDPSDEERARSILRTLAEAWLEVQPARELREKAERALLLHPLSSADSLQLAAALVWARGHAPGREFVCLDRRLAEAARREGFSVLP